MAYRSCGRYVPVAAAGTDAGLYSPASMAAAKTKRKQRKREGAPRAVASTRRSERAAKQAQSRDARRRASRDLGREGERPRGLFGAVPVSEVAILAGMVAAIVGFINESKLPVIVGLVICGLGVVEVTGREHFSGYRSHSALLAAVPSIAIEAGIVAAFGDPQQRAWLLVIIVPLFAVLFFALRHRFRIARQARVARTARASAPRSVS
jgi:type IV secretory pathway TrbD component